MSKPQGNPVLLGAFVAGGMALVLAAVIASGGGKLFARKEQAVMYFTGSIYGLQVGAPVVFRGVPLGNVSDIGLVYNREDKGFAIPVVVDLNPRVIRGLGDVQDADAPPTLPGLVARGLRAQLSMQSLLTGQLYVDLDLQPGKPSNPRRETAGLVEIPTSNTAIQALKAQLDTLDVKRLLDDVSAIAASARAMVAGPQLRQSLDNLVEITARARTVTQALDQQIGPLARSTEATLAETRRALASLGQAASQVGASADRMGRSADRVGRTADRFGDLADPNAPLVQQLLRTADELARTAAALRQTTGGDAPLAQGAERALNDVSQAARAVRGLADALAQEPNALLRGRSAEPAWPGATDTAPAKAAPK